MLYLVCELGNFAWNRADSQRDHFKIDLTYSLQVDINKLFSQLYFRPLNVLFPNMWHRDLILVQSKHEEHLLVIIGGVIIGLKPDLLIVAYSLELWEN
jgi:hypothetical protein